MAARSAADGDERVAPGRGGQNVGDIPVYGTIAEARAEHEIDVTVLFVPARFARVAAMEAVEAGIRHIHILAEGVPYHDTAHILAAADEAGWGRRPVLLLSDC